MKFNIKGNKNNFKIETYGKKYKSISFNYFGDIYINGKNISQPLGYASDFSVGPDGLKYKYISGIYSMFDLRLNIKNILDMIQNNEISIHTSFFGVTYIDLDIEEEFDRLIRLYSL